MLGHQKMPQASSLCHEQVEIFQTLSEIYDLHESENKNWPTHCTRRLSTACRCQTSTHQITETEKISFSTPKIKLLQKQRIKRLTYKKLHPIVSVIHPCFACIYSKYPNTYWNCSLYHYNNNNTLSQFLKPVSRMCCIFTILLF